MREQSVYRFSIDGLNQLIANGGAWENAITINGVGDRTFTLRESFRGQQIKAFNVGLAGALSAVPAYTYDAAAGTLNVRSWNSAGALIDTAVQLLAFTLGNGPNNDIFSARVDGAAGTFLHNGGAWQSIVRTSAGLYSLTLDPDFIGAPVQFALDILSADTTTARAIISTFNIPTGGLQVRTFDAAAADMTFQVAGFLA